MSITYDLDASGSPTNSYRVEFYANEKRSIFGYGPGETFLGAVSVSPGNNQTATIAVSGDYAGKALSATATAIDPTTTSGFGSTSEFSQNISIGSHVDFDADGVSDSIENAGPNNGDANNDSYQDSTQPTVTSFKNSAGIYSTLVIDGCSDSNSVSSLDVNSINRKDNGYAYPFGLSAFTLNCSRGDTADVQIFIHSSAVAKNFIPRKFNTSTSEYSEVLGANITQATVGDSTALKLSYSVTDGGMYDDDGTENGIIVDPIGLATEQEATTPAGQLANTGIATIITTFLAGGIIAIVIYTYLDYRSHKKPLVIADKETGTQASKGYTYWHHLRIVSIPLAKYRLSIAIEKKQNSKANISA
ncbi:hypothetical protein KC968_03110 [Candidatus Saccharibacteria bacterium]|nr:hypothetical protein [Candidatus Saccharibacteria bacterium]